MCLHFLPFPDLSQRRKWSPRQAPGICPINCGIVKDGGQNKKCGSYNGSIARRWRRKSGGAQTLPQRLQTSDFTSDRDWNAIKKTKLVCCSSNKVLERISNLPQCQSNRRHFQQDFHMTNAPPQATTFKHYHVNVGQNVWLSIPGKLKLSNANNKPLKVQSLSCEAKTALRAVVAPLNETLYQLLDAHPGPPMQQRPFPRFQEP